VNWFGVLPRSTQLVSVMTVFFGFADFSAGFCAEETATAATMQRDATNARTALLQRQQYHGAPFQ